MELNLSDLIGVEGIEEGTSAIVNPSSPSANNFGNLRPVGKSEGFQQFSSPEEGLAAMDKNLQVYGSKHGINTLRGVINRWAPSSENDVNSYIKHAQQVTGLKADDEIDLSNPATRHLVSTAIMLHEKGPKAFLASGGSVAKVAAAQEPKQQDAQIEFNLSDLVGEEQVAPEQKVVKPIEEDTKQPLTRQLGLTARHVIEGTAETLELATAPLTALLNLVTPTSSTTALGKKAADLMGLPTPKKGLETEVAQASKFLVSGAGWVKGASIASKALTGVAQQAARILAENPLSQAASLVAGSLAGSVAEDQGVGEAGQLAAFLAGGLVGGFAGLKAESWMKMKTLMPEASYVTKPQTVEEATKTMATTQRVLNEPSSGSLITDTQKFINENLGIKTTKAAAERAAFATDREYAQFLRESTKEIPLDSIKLRRAEVRAAFTNDKEYADFLANSLDDKVALRTAWQKQTQPGTGGTLQAMVAKAEATLGGTGQKGFGQGGEVALWENLTANERSAIDLAKNYTNPQKFNKTTLPKKLENYRLSQLPGFKEGGEVTNRLLLNMSGTIAGGITGALFNPDEPVVGAMFGAALGAGGVHALTKLPAALSQMRGATNQIKNVYKTLEDTRYRIDDLTNQHNFHINAASRATMQLTSKIRDAVPDLARREAIHHWIEGTPIKLSPQEMAVAKQAQAYYATMNEAATSAGVYTEGWDNYVNHIWDFDKKGGSALLKSLFGERGGSTSSAFGKGRTIETSAKGIELGFKPKTLDIADDIDIYSNSMNRAIENKKLVNTLTQTVIPTTKETLVINLADGGKIPHGYKQIGGLAVHPDIEGPMKVIFENYNPNVMARGVLGLTMATKRLAVSYSLFHAKALTDAYIGAGGSTKELAKMVSGESNMLKMLRQGGAGDLVDIAQEGGLVFGKATLDVDPKFMHMLFDDVGNVLDAAGKHAGIDVKLSKYSTELLKKTDKVIDTFMWERLHTGMKLQVFSQEYEKAILKNAQAHAKDGTIPLIDKKKTAQDVASSVNDLFGGLNWNRIFNESKTKWGREVMMAISAPSGRAMSQILMFAPDWTLSTTRAALKAFKFSEPQVAKLHWKYIARSALYYFSIGEALNWAMSDHSILDNKDMTRLELSDGRTMQFSKHAMEPIHWGTEPVKQLRNKLGFVPKEMLAQLTNLGQYGEVGPLDRALHAAKAFIPISAQQVGDKDLSTQTAVEMGASFLGMPIYGKTTADKTRDSFEKKLKRRINSKEALLKKYTKK